VTGHPRTADCPAVGNKKHCSFLIGAAFVKNGMAAILNFRFMQKPIIKDILAFRSRMITIFMSKPTFSGLVNANVPLKMTPDGFNHTKQESPAIAKEDALQPIQLLLQYRPSKSSKVCEFHLIWKSLSHFLLMIVIVTLALSCSLKFSLKIAAKPLQIKTWLLLKAYRKLPYRS